MNNQYINNATEDEEIKGINKTGILRVKELQNKLEYHLYNNKLPAPNFVESVDLNATLQIHLYSVIKKPIYINISSNNEVLFEGIGKLTREYQCGVEKFYLDGRDIEEVLFFATEQTVNIKINTVHNEETDEIKEGETKVDGLQES